MAQESQVWSYPVWRLAVVLLALFACWQACGEENIVVPEVRTVSLSNGIPLYHVVVRDDSSFALQIIVWGGRHADTPGKGGLGHVLEHLLFEHPDTTPQAFFREITERGGTYGGYTENARWVYEVSMPKEALETGIDWLARVVHHEALQFDKLDGVKSIIRDEKGWHDQIAEKLEALYSPLWFFEKYERTMWDKAFGIQYAHENASAFALRGITPADVQSHYAAYHVAENMVVLYAGPHSLEETSAMLQARLENIPRGKPPTIPEIAATQFRPYIEYGMSGSGTYNSGHLFLDASLSDQYFRGFYGWVVQQLLQDELRHRQGQTYAVDKDYWRLGTSETLQFKFTCAPESGGKNKELADSIIFGDLSQYLSETDYDSYRTSYVRSVLRGRKAQDCLTRLSSYYFARSREQTEITYWRDVASLLQITHAEFLSKVVRLRSESKPFETRGLDSKVIVAAFPITLLLPFLLARWRHRRRRPSESIIEQSSAKWLVYLGRFAAFFVSLYLVIALGTIVEYYVDALTETWTGYVLDGILAFFLLGCLCLVFTSLLAVRLLKGSEFLYLQTAGWRGIRIPYASITRVEIRKMSPNWKALASAHVLAFRVRWVAIHYGRGKTLGIYVADPENLLRFLEEKISIAKDRDAAGTEEPENAAFASVPLPAEKETR